MKAIVVLLIALLIVGCMSLPEPEVQEETEYRLVFWQNGVNIKSLLVHESPKLEWISYGGFTVRTWIAIDIVGETHYIRETDNLTFTLKNAKGEFR